MAPLPTPARVAPTRNSSRLGGCTHAADTTTARPTTSTGMPRASSRLSGHLIVEIWVIAPAPNETRTASPASTGDGRCRVSDRNPEASPAKTPNTAKTMKSPVSAALS